MMNEEKNAVSIVYANNAGDLSLNQPYYEPPQKPNKILRCMVVDDEPHAVDLIRRHIKDTPFLQLVYAATHPVEIIDKAAKEPFDLLFSDVEMPVLSGFNLIDLLRGKCHFVLCTGFKKYALKGYEHDICDYLLKPILYSRFLKAATKVQQQILNENEHRQTNNIVSAQEYLLLKGDRKYRHVHICLNDIDYIEGAGHYVFIIAKGEKKIIHISLKQLQQQLPQNRFVRVHHSYIVPVNKITFIDTDEVGLQNARHPLPLGAVYRDALLMRLKKQG
jgi:two-component system, LytTR family, response regulator